MKFRIDDGTESWTPVMKGAFERSDPDSDGSVKSPHPYRKESLALHTLVEKVTYFQVDGIPRLHFRHGNTRNSYRWTPIIPSPIASRTRNKTKCTDDT